MKGHDALHRPIIWRPQPRQAAFLARPEDEALYGGAAGGGKSDALVMEALRQEGDATRDGTVEYPPMEELEPPQSGEGEPS